MVSGRLQATDAIWTTTLLGHVDCTQLQLGSMALRAASTASSPWRRRARVPVRVAISRPLCSQASKTQITWPLQRTDNLLVAELKR